MATLTTVHVLISLIAIGFGFVVLVGLVRGKRLDSSTAVFLLMTAATSATGFLFRRDHIMPSHIVGIISLVVVGLAMVARYPKHLEGRWRWVYVVSAVAALYFNVFVLVAQSFAKVPALHAIAPTQSEAPFKATQAAVLVAFIVLGIVSARRFHPERVTHSSAVSPLVAHR